MNIADIIKYGIYNHSFHWHNIKILDDENNYFTRLMSEILHIGSKTIAINVKINTKNLNTLFL